MSTLPTTELDAINYMLATIGEAPVNTAEDPGVVDAVMARHILDDVNREVQSEGWHWNTRVNVTLVPDSPFSEIRVPATTLRCDTSGDSIETDVLLRDTRLFNKANNSYRFIDEAGNPFDVTVDLVELIPFKHLPETARTYIKHRASQKFAEAMVGSSEMVSWCRKTADASEARLRTHEIEDHDATYLSGATVLRTLAR